MSDTIIRLFPAPAIERPLHGLYLDSPLLPEGWNRPLYVYTNYVASLDGRIAVADSPDERPVVPDSIANPRDWRLFQELAAHADVLLASGRYLRDLAAGIAQDALPLGEEPWFTDLQRWRRERGLPAQPDIAVLSASLDIELPRQWFEQGRTVLVFTGSAAAPARAEALREVGARVIAMPGTRVRGRELTERLTELGYRRLYAIAGPYVLRTLLADDVVDTFFLTRVHRLVGGSAGSGLLEGAPLKRPADFRLSTLYYDPHAFSGVGQSMARYDRAE